MLFGIKLPRGFINPFLCLIVKIIKGRKMIDKKVNDIPQLPPSLKELEQRIIDADASLRDGQPSEVRGLVYDYLTKEGYSSVGLRIVAMVDNCLKDIGNNQSPDKQGDELVLSYTIETLYTLVVAPGNVSRFFPYEPGLSPTNRQCVAAYALRVLGETPLACLSLRSVRELGREYNSHPHIKKAGASIPALYIERPDGVKKVNLQAA